MEGEEEPPCTLPTLSPAHSLQEGPGQEAQWLPLPPLTTCLEVSPVLGPTLANTQASHSNTSSHNSQQEGARLLFPRLSTLG